MKIPTLLLLTASVLGIAAAEEPAPPEPVKLIFDTDMGNDIDDAMALALIHQLERRGACELLAVTSTKDHPLSAPYIDALNTFYGNPDVPIGAVKESGVTPEEGKYNGHSQKKNDDGSLLYPHDLASGEDAPDAVALLRKTLAEQPDNSVKLLQVGFFTNLSRLLDSKADEFSDLSGKDLIRKKVKETVIMAGAFQPIRHNTRYREYNVFKDVPSARKMAAEWPGPLVWSGFEIGIAATYPWKSIMEDYNYVDHHIVKEGYLDYAPEKPHDRPTWDLTAVLYAVYPDRGYFDLSPPGQIVVDETGHTDYNTARKPENQKGNDRYLIMDEVQTERVREAFVQLCSEPPVGK